MFEYKCPKCGWAMKSPEKFTVKKPCLNCDGFVELQAAQQSVSGRVTTWRKIRVLVGGGSGSLHPLLTPTVSPPAVIRKELQ